MTATSNCPPAASRGGILAHGFRIGAPRCSGSGGSVAARGMGLAMGQRCSEKGRLLARCLFGS